MHYLLVIIVLLLIVRYVHRSRYSCSANYVTLKHNRNFAAAPDYECLKRRAKTRLARRLTLRTLP